MSFFPFLVIFGIILIFVLLSFLFNSLKSYFTKEKNVKKINIEKKDIVESNETDEDFNKRINQLKTQTKLDWREELKKNVSEKRERYFKEVDNQIIKIISELKDEIEKDAKGENTFGFPMEKFEFDIIDGNNELLSLPITEHFIDNVIKRDTYKSLENECKKFFMKVKIIPINIGYLDPNNFHPLEPTLENYKILISVENKFDDIKKNS